MKRRAGWFRYLKEAFVYRWNLLLFGGAAAAAAISGHADVALPLVMAGEVAYLGGLTTLPRFQAAIDAKSRSEDRGLATASAPPPQEKKQQLAEILGSLEPDRRSRFLRLRARCMEMQRIANAVRGETRDESGASTELRTPALDRLLWGFLKLLLSQQALQRFLKAADGPAIQKQLADLKAKQEKAKAKGDERIVRAVADAVVTAELRLENYQKANDNDEFIDVELDRLENKIQALTEMAISHQDPGDLSTQLDAVAEGMTQTEQTIKDLQSITGLGQDATEAPQIMGTDVEAQ
ncbi:MAG TPA: hypothetical protein VHE35_02220 [Kofleriaceae bacterium]|nr:hypothetical protein [Kofleriaceae bacterium]